MVVWSLCGLCAAACCEHFACIHFRAYCFLIACCWLLVLQAHVGVLALTCVLYPSLTAPWCWWVCAAACCWLPPLPQGLLAANDFVCGLLVAGRLNHDACLAAARIAELYAASSQPPAVLRAGWLAGCGVF